MRLWHVDLLEKLPKQWLLGQHRECCALRGKGWGKKHSVVDYVFTHPFACLYHYHMRVISILEKFGCKIDEKWKDIQYRGKVLGYDNNQNYAGYYRYPEHDQEYLDECVENLRKKGIIMQIYQEHGYENRQDYLKCLAEDYGVDIETVSALADMLGPEEDFDGLLTALEDV